MRIVVCVHVGCHVITAGATSLPGVGILKHRFAHEVLGSPAPREPLMHLSQPRLALYEHSWRLSHGQLVPVSRNCSSLLGVADAFLFHTIPLKRLREEQVYRTLREHPMKEGGS